MTKILLVLTLISVFIVSAVVLEGNRRHKLRRPRLFRPHRNGVSVRISRVREHVRTNATPKKKATGYPATVFIPNMIIETARRPVVKSRRMWDIFGCHCHITNCSCCAHIDWPDIHVNETVCAHMAFYPERFIFEAWIDFNGYVLYNETVDARNPSPMCVSVPYRNQFSVCLHMHDLEIRDYRFWACANLQLKMYSDVLANQPIGCFSVPIQMTRMRIKQLLLERYPFRT